MNDGDEARPGSGEGARASLARRLLSLVVLPGAIGAATGACVALASGLVEGLALRELASLPGSVPALFSLAALPLTLLVVRYVTRVAHPATAEVYILAFHSKDGRVRLRELPGRVLAAAATVACGGSQGLESPSALIGASLGQVASGRLRRLVSPEDRRSLLAAGASAGIAAVFSSPGVGTLYGIEVPFRRDVDAPRLVPAAVAAGLSYATHAALLGPRHLVTLDAVPPVDAAFVAGCLLTALGCGLGARLFAAATIALRALGERLGAWPRALAGSAVLAALAWTAHAVSGAWITFGPGYFAADWLASADHSLLLLATVLVLRTAGTLTCVFGGGGGGVFTSLAVTGVLLGAIVGELVGRIVPGAPGDVFAILGAGCFLGAGYRIPLAGMLLVAEATGDLAITVAGLASVALGQVLMGDASVSDAQRERRATMPSERAPEGGIPTPARGARARRTGSTGYGG